MGRRRMLRRVEDTGAFVLQSRHHHGQFLPDQEVEEQKVSLPGAGRGGTTPMALSRLL